MSKLKPFLSIPEVKNGVICDRAGTLLEHSNMEDAESIAAVMGYMVNTLAQCGESLGLSEPTMFNLSGKDISCYVFAESNLLWVLYLDPASSQQEFERKIETMKRTGRIE
jgi:hypothetical protein